MVIWTRLATWLRERRFYASIRPTDLFIVYFPRSGGFWLQSVFAALRKHSPTPLRFEDIEAYVPNLNNGYYFERRSLGSFAAFSDPRVFKVHAPPDPRLQRVVFMVRDPRDAFLSYYYYLQWFEPKFDMTLEKFVLENEMWPMDWGEHTNGWLELAETRKHLVLRYEDMQADPKAFCRKALDYAGVSASDEALKMAIAEAWRENQRRRDGMYADLLKRGGPEVRDFRSDGVGAHARAFSADLNERFCVRYRSIMERLGYLPSRS